MPGTPNCSKKIKYKQQLTKNPGAFIIYRLFIYLADVYGLF